MDEASVSSDGCSEAPDKLGDPDPGKDRDL